MSDYWLVDREGRNALSVGRVRVAKVGALVVPSDITHWPAVRAWIRDIAQGRPVEVADDSDEWEPWDGHFYVRVGWKVYQMTEPCPERRNLWKPEVDT